MKRLLLLVLLLLTLVAIALSPILIGEKGYILIAMGDLTIESTVVTATIMLILLFITLLITLKAFRGGLHFSFTAWNKIAFASRRRALRDLNKGIAAYILGEYKQSEHLLAKCAESSSLEHIAYLVAADAAHKQGLKPNTDHYLALLEKTNASLKNTGLEAVLIKIKLLMGQKNYQQAREIIDQHHKHIGHDARLLSLEIELSLIEQRFDYAIKQLDTAKKQKTITEQTIIQWQQVAFYGAFNQQIKQQSKQALMNFWQQLSKKDKQTEAIALTYCQVLAENNIDEPLVTILLPVIKKGSNATLLKSIRRLPITQADELVAAIQKHLHKDPHNPLWLSLMAHFSLSAQQWSLAEKAFNSLVNLEGTQYDNVDLLAFSQVLEQQQQFEKANRVLRKIHS